MQKRFTQGIPNAVSLNSQLIVWCFLLLTYWLYKEFIGKEDFDNYVDFIILFCINLALFYLNALWVLPKALKRKQKGGYRVFLIISLELLLLTVLMIGLSAYLGGLTIEFTRESWTFVSISNFFIICFPLYVGTSLSYAYYLFIWGKLQEHDTLNERREKLEEEQKNAALEKQSLILRQDWIKSRLPIHFLANALTSLTYIVENEPEIAKEYTDKLIDIMDYYIEESENGFILLKQEIDQVRRYIDLMEFSVMDRLHVDMDFQGDFQGVKTLPMIILLLVENILKYGIVKDPTCPARILVSHLDGVLTICAENCIRPYRIGLASTGIGLDSLKQNLASFYLDCHRFELSNQNAVFKVTIQTWENDWNCFFENP